jgi:hypothetical protein
MTTKLRNLAVECRREEESCLFTSTSLFIWLRCLRVLRVLFAVVPVTLGSLASWNLLTASPDATVKTFAAICSFLAGLLPTLYLALKLDGHVEDTAQLAAEFKNLQDRFRAAALVTAKKSFDALETEHRYLMERLEEARKKSITPPECCFLLARRKINKGHYTFDVELTGAEENG